MSDTNQRIYLSGEITCGGTIEPKPSQAQRFFEAARALRYRGHDVVNPAEWEPGGTVHYYRKKSIGELLSCTAIGVLKGAGQESFSHIEQQIGVLLGLPLLDADEGSRCANQIEPESIFSEADRLLFSERAKAYAAIEAITPKYVEAVRSVLPNCPKCNTAVPFEPRHYPLMLAAIKAVRESVNPRRDTRIDGAAYWRWVDRMVEPM